MIPSTEPRHLERKTTTHQTYGGTHYERHHIRTAFFCPGCGKQGTWVEDDEGDYYCGPAYHCDACGAEGSMWRP